MRIAARILILGAAVGLGGCSSTGFADLDSFQAPTPERLFRPLSVTGVKEKVLPPVTPDELVDASGRCAGAFVPPAPDAGQSEGAPGQPDTSLQQAGVPVIPTAVALDMTECDVVKRAGFPERVEIGANERNERTARLTYINGQRPGIYSFVEGRLKSMERAPEPPAPPKPTKKKPTRQKPRQATVQVQ